MVIVKSSIAWDLPARGEPVVISAEFEAEPCRSRP